MLAIIFYWQSLCEDLPTSPRLTSYDLYTHSHFVFQLQNFCFHPFQLRSSLFLPLDLYVTTTIHLPPLFTKVTPTQCADLG